MDTVLQVIPICDTCGLKIRFKILICNLHVWYYAFCIGLTHFALVLLFNCTTLSQSELSTFFMYVTNGFILIFNSFPLTTVVPVINYIKFKERKKLCN